MPFAKSTLLCCVACFLSPTVVGQIASPMRPMFGAASTYTGVPDAGPIAAGDFDGDGDVDLVAITIKGQAPGRGTVFLNRGDGSFATGPTVPSQLAGGNVAHSMIAGDFDGDRDLDLVVAYTSPLGLPNTVLYLLSNDGKAGFSRQSFLWYTTGGQRSTMVAADFDLDGDLDLVVSHEQSHGVWIVRNDRGTLVRASDIETDFSPSGLGLGDVDGDGDPDVVVVHPGTDSLQVLTNSGRGSFTKGSKLSVGATPLAVCVVDLDADRVPEIVTTHLRGAVEVRTRVGSSYRLAASYDTGPAPRNLAVADFNLDGLPEIVVPHMAFGWHSTMVFWNRAGLKLEGTPVFGGGAPYDIAVDDYNADGIPDLAVSNRGSGDVSVFLEEGARVVLREPALNTAALTLYAPRDAGKLYLAPFTLRSQPGIPLPDGRTIPLALDPLFLLSLRTNPYFRNTIGFLDAFGTAALQLALPTTPSLVGRRLFTAGIVLDPAARHGIGTITEAAKVVVVDRFGGGIKSQDPPELYGIYPEVFSSGNHRVPVTVVGKNLMTPDLHFRFQIGFFVPRNVKIVSDDKLVCEAPDFLAGRGQFQMSFLNGAGRALHDGPNVADRVRVSYKRLLQPSTFRRGRYAVEWADDRLLYEYVAFYNKVSSKLQRGIWLEPDEIVDVLSGQWAVRIPITKSAEFERHAKQTIAFGWRSDAVNAFLTLAGDTFATLPTPGRDGVLVMGPRLTPRYQPATLDHELGHFFGLYHTFDSREPIADTPTDPYDVTKSPCANVDALAARYGRNSSEFKTLRCNLMSYYRNCACTSSDDVLMTRGQILAARQVLQSTRRHIVK